MKLLSGCVLLLVMLACTAFAAEASYDVRRYDLDIRPDFAAKSLQLRATIDIANPQLATRFEFELWDRYSQVSVTANGAPAKVERRGDTVTVVVPKPTRRVRLVFSLAGAPGNCVDESRPVLDADSLFLLWSDAWYPEVFDDWAHVRTTITLPPDYKVIAPGREVRTQADGALVRHVFEARNPAVVFSVFADRRWIRTERVVNGIRMQTLLHPESQPFADQIFRTSGDVVKYFADLHGGYPFDQFSFVTLTGMGARRAFNGFVGYTPQYLEREMKTTGHDAHETALLWWCYLTHGTGPGSWQWTEGLGDYVEMMYDEARGLPLPGIFTWFRKQYLASAAKEDIPYSKLRGNTPQKLVHGKYPWIMQALREELGDTAFHAFLRDLFTRYRYRAFTMDDFVATAERAAGRPLTQWREAWLERPGPPPREVKVAREGDSPRGN